MIAVVIWLVVSFVPGGDCPICVNAPLVLRITDSNEFPTKAACLLYLDSAEVNGLYVQGSRANYHCAPFEVRRAPQGRGNDEPAEIFIR